MREWPPFSYTTSAVDKKCGHVQLVLTADRNNSTNNNGRLKYICHGVLYPLTTKATCGIATYYDPNLKTVCNRIE